MAIGDKKPVVMESDIINDLTTGGTKAALSAEMGKTLDAKKVSKAGDTMTGSLAIDPSNSDTARLFLIGDDNADGKYPECRIIKNSSATKDYGTQIRDFTFHNSDETKSVALIISDAKTTLAEKLQLLVTDTDTSTGLVKNTYYNVLHTGNKPSGSYTGNGDATQRTIDTGGIGSVVVIYGSNGFAIATPKGAIGFVSSNFTVTGFAGCTFSSGKLYIASTNSLVNANNVTYNYQVM